MSRVKESRVFRSSSTMWSLLGPSILAALLGVCVVHILLNAQECFVYGRESVHPAARAEFYHLARNWLYLAIPYAIAFLASLWLAVRCRMESRKTLVIISADGVMVTNWRGNETRIGWDEITELTINLPSFVGNPPVSIGSERQHVVIPRDIADRQQLIRDVIEGANLIPMPGTAFRKTYRHV